MAFNLRNRNFLKLLDFSTQEIQYMLQLAADLKKAKYAGTEQPRLKGKNIALLKLQLWIRAHTLPTSALQDRRLVKRKP